MNGHRTYLDTHRIIVTRAVKPPLPRGHRKWLTIAQGMSREARRREGGSGPSGLTSPVATPCAQKVQP